ncbi:MAG: isoprenylcysteine carboxylmethyltransferase family protein [Acidobacteriia bacterium]|nr:isoprenylcysteine carboxylmethyltransferase family protein [Terriglobia bacterium]
MKDLDKRAFGGLVWLLASMGVLLFLPAWTLDYREAWIFLVVFSASVLAITLYLMKNDPRLLERRMHSGPGAEKEGSQKVIQFIATIAFIAVIVLPAMDHRFAWSVAPLYAVVAGDVFVALGMLVIFLVFKENTFASATIEVDSGQKVISSGPYALVRHPMYLGALIMLLGVAPALGSWFGLFAAIPLALVIVWRLLDEEEFLARSLPGYSEYRNKVKYRLVPFIW